MKNEILQFKIMTQKKQGGKREGAGRKKGGKEQLFFWTFPELKEKIQEEIKKLEKTFVESK